MTSSGKNASKAGRAQELTLLLAEVRQLDIYDPALWQSSYTLEDYGDQLEDLLYVEPEVLDAAMLTEYYLSALTAFLDSLEKDNTFLSEEEKYLLPPGLLNLRARLESFYALPRALGLERLHEVIFGSGFAGPYLEGHLPESEKEGKQSYRKSLNDFLARPTEKKFTALCARASAILKHQARGDKYEQSYHWQTPELILEKLEALEVFLLLQKSPTSMRESIAFMQEFLGK